MAIQKVHYSFKPGFDLLKNSQTPAAKADLMQVLGLKYETTFYKKNAKTTPISLLFSRKKIKEIFSKYGVDKRDIWDIQY